MLPPARRITFAAAAWSVLLAACSGSELAPNEHASDDEGNWASVSAGRDHSCALDRAGRAFCWGSNAFGQLGRAGGDTVCGPFATQCERTPTAVATELRFTALSAGSTHTCGITTSRALYCWGDNTAGELGADVPSGPTPVLVPVDAVTAVSAGDGHTCAIRVDGFAYCWGANTRGQLGIGSLAPQRSPQRVALDEHVGNMSAGLGRTCARTVANATYCWGAVWMYRQDGLEYTRSEPLPVLVPRAPPITALSVGAFATCGVATTGVVHCWEANPYGQLGTGALQGSTIPVPIASARRFAGVSASIIHTCGITVDGEAFCWGDDTFGELGVPRGSLPDTCNGNGCSTNPVAVDIAERFVGISAGFGNHTCGITVRHGLYCWGLGIWGQRGDGTADYMTSVPVRALAPRS